MQFQLSHAKPLLLILTLCLSACGDEMTYDGFAESYHRLVFDSANYDTYIASAKPQNSRFFYPCLDKHRARNNNEAQRRINQCLDIHGDDAVGNLNCNNSSGTEFFEARRDLMELKKLTLMQNLNIDTLETQGFLLGEVECFAINTVRSLEGLPGLSCVEIGNQYREQFKSQNRCRFEKNQGFFEQIWGGGDWEIK